MSILSDITEFIGLGSGDNLSGPLIQGLIGGALGLGKEYMAQSGNAAALEQSNRQFEAQFEYAKERAAQQDALAIQLANIRAGGGGDGGASKMADVYKKRTLVDAYNNYLQALAGQRGDELQAYELLQRGATAPLMASMGRR